MAAVSSASFNRPTLVQRGMDWNLLPFDDVDLDDPRLEAVTALRVARDNRGRYFVVYCEGMLRDGTPVNVNLPFEEVDFAALPHFLWTEARKAGIEDPRAFGVLDAVSVAN
jgi:hypothetical protein